ncbi:MAG TPA: hypothetical protein VMU80_20700 [Bryobacteraceae bacterium]|nr:hypothetical protein [Bryobacteraceae bacterium]
MAITAKASGESPERVKLTFPIEKDVCYHCLKRGRISAIGVGKTIQISSYEVRFTTQRPLQQGERVQLAVDWPATLDNACLMKLQILGVVSEILPGAAAVRIARYEFRTRGASLRVMHSMAS